MKVSRRVLLKNLSWAAGLSAALSRHPSSAAEQTRLDVMDPAAIALGYVENAAQVDIKKYAQFVKGSNCENCLLLQGAVGSNYRPCSLFPGKLVSVGGWCKGWTAEM
jgi:hypothetical protein